MIFNNLRREELKKDIKERMKEKDIKGFPKYWYFLWIHKFTFYSLIYRWQDTKDNKHLKRVIEDLNMPVIVRGGIYIPPKKTLEDYLPKY